LRNTIEWSYDLLDASEQQLFRRLCVFVGGATLSAVEAVSTALGDQPGAVLDGIASHIDKSLLRQSESVGEQPRFVMLETIREYGWEALSASGEVEATRKIHAAYYLALAEETAPELHGPHIRERMRQLEQEHDNLRAAMGWLLEGEEATMALRMGTALCLYWDIHYHYHEELNFLEQALVGSEHVESTLRAMALAAAALAAISLGRFEQGDILGQQALALFQANGDTAGMEEVVYRLGLVAFNKGDFAAARPLFEQSLKLSREVGSKNFMAYSLNSLAFTALYQAEYAGIRALLEESLALFREVGNTYGIAWSLGGLADYAIEGPGDLDLAQAQVWAEESLALFREIGTRNFEPIALALLGQIVFYQGDTTTAHLLLEQSCTLYREVGNEIQTAWTLFLLGKVFTAEGDLAAARAVCEESLALEIRLNVGQSAVDIPPALESLAAVVAAQGEPTWAARLLGRAEAQRETIGIPLPPLNRAENERASDCARAGLDEPSFTAAWAEGRAMTLEQVFAARGPVMIPKPPTPTSQPAIPPPEE
jgi:tetratricopeptide (TPR) repeat protein